MGKVKIILVVVIVAIVVGGASFYGGMMYGKSSAASNRPSFQGGMMGTSDAGMQKGIGNGNGTSNGNNMLSGEIASKDNESITITLKDGGSKIVFFTNSTTITKNETGSSEDLEAGKEIVITGSSNDDGSVSAQSIQIKSE